MKTVQETSEHDCPGPREYPELLTLPHLHSTHRVRRALAPAALAGGLALLAAAGYLFAAVPAAADTARAYRAALPCPDAEPGGDCIRESTATVTEVHLTNGGRSGSSYVRLADHDLPVGTVELHHDTDAADHWKPGDRLTVRQWRGQIVSLSDGTRQVPTDSVTDTDIMLAGTGLLATTTGAAALALATTRLRRAAQGPGCRPDLAWYTLRPALITAWLWTVTGMIIPSVCRLPLAAATAIWLTGALFTARAAVRAVYRTRCGRHPGQDPAAHSPYLDRLFGDRALLLPLRRAVTRDRDARLARGARIEFDGRVLGDTPYAGATALALQDGALYAEAAPGMGALARRLPLADYRLHTARPLHPVGSPRTLLLPYDWQVAHLRRNGDGDEGEGGGGEELAIATDPAHLRRILHLLPQGAADASYAGTGGQRT